jgi:putative DNA primase/helicase
MMSVVSRVIGAYAMPIAIESLLHNDRKRGGEATPDLAELPGARLVMASEPEIGARLSESVVKIATGGERMTARPLYEKPLSFDPTFKLMFSCNARPSIRGKDDGIWRRVLMVPFTVTVPPERRDTQLAARLFDNEAAGILNWALDGWRLYQEDRSLAVPAAVRDATDEYRIESDPVGQFIGACVLRRPSKTINATALYRCYEAWCRGSAIDPVNQNVFGRLMSDRGHKREKTGVYHYIDIELTPVGEKLLDVHSEDPEAATAHQG